MNNSFINRLNSGEILVSNGATGTNLQDMGIEIGVPPEDWVLDHPENLQKLDQQFISAGSEIILTDTFGGTRVRMRDSQYSERAYEINVRAARLARESAGESVFVAGSIGPSGQLIEPLGEITFDELVDNFAEQARALTEGGVDLLLIETMFSLDEARAAIEGAKKSSPLPLVVSFSYDQGTRTMMGTRPSEVIRDIVPLGVAAIGANCGKSLPDMESILREMVEANPGVPIWIKPNAGLPTGVPPRYETTPEQMGAWTLRYLEIGAQIVGGCCGNTPAHVAEIARAAKKFKLELARA